MCIHWIVRTCTEDGSGFIYLFMVSWLYIECDALHDSVGLSVREIAMEHEGLSSGLIPL